MACVCRCVAYRGDCASCSRGVAAAARGAAGHWPRPAKGRQGAGHLRQLRPAGAAVQPHLRLLLLLLRLLWHKACVENYLHRHNLPRRLHVLSQTGNAKQHCFSNACSTHADVGWNTRMQQKCSIQLRSPFLHLLHGALVAVRGVAVLLRQGAPREAGRRLGARLVEALVVARRWETGGLVSSSHQVSSLQQMPHRADEITAEPLLMTDGESPHN